MTFNLSKDFFATKIDLERLINIINMYLSSRGYVVPKEESVSFDELKSQLTVEPHVIQGYGPAQNEPFRTYLESNSKLYIPKFYGLQKFGVPSLNKIPEGDDINVRFTGSLRSLQEDATSAVLDACRDPMRMGGLLCLRCGEGKTVCGINMICQLGKKALIVVHKEFLLDQWKERIMEFAPSARLGLIKAKVIDVENKDIVLASLQSLSMKEYDPKVLHSFGTVIVDECHHMGAQVFSQALKKVNFRYSIGLTATPKRKDGLTKVFTWFLGDIVFESAQRKDSLEVRFYRYYDANPDYSRQHMLYTQKPNVSKMINSICDFSPRIEFLATLLRDILKEEPMRKTLILSDRRQHLHLIKDMLEGTSQITSGFYYGGLSASQLKESESKQVLLATFQYASEGFDMKGLDTLILASPKSDVIQVVGRILRDKPEDRKHVPLVIDIVDDFSVFSNQAQKRYRYYKSCKYTIQDADELFKPVKKQVKIPQGRCLL